MSTRKQKTIEIDTVAAAAIEEIKKIQSDIVKYNDELVKVDAVKNEVSAQFELLRRKIDEGENRIRELHSKIDAALKAYYA